MDANFLELFGQMLIQAAKGQRQMDQFSNWMQQGFDATTIPEFKDYFQRIYGLTDISKESDQYTKLFQKAQTNFLSGYGEFAELLGLVPKKRYDALKQAYTDLEEKYQNQEKMIAKLKAKFEKGINPNEDLTDQFTDLIEQQKNEFTKTVKVLQTYIHSNKMT